MSQLPKRIGKDTHTNKAMGDFHYHACEWCGVDVACFDGSECDKGRRQGLCSQECHDGETPYGYRVGLTTGENGL